MSSQVVLLVEDNERNLKLAQVAAQIVEQQDLLDPR